MAAAFQNGKFYVLLLLLILVPLPRFNYLVSCNSSIEPEHEQDQVDNHVSVPDRQEIQLKNLQELIKNLNETITRLESAFSECLKIGSGKTNVRELGLPIPDKIDSGVDYSSTRSLKAPEDREQKSHEEDREGRGVTVTKYKPSWSERFQFLSAAKLEFEPTCINVLPFEHHEGLSKFVAVGDERGRVYIFLSNGDILVEFYTLSDSPITSMLSYLSFYKNESVLVTGHKDGSILAHRVWEAANGDDWNSLSVGNSRAFVFTKKGEEGLSIKILEAHQLGRMRYVIASDINGKISVFRENGTVQGTVMPPSRPLVFLKQRLLFLTENSAVSLDLRSMKVRQSECEGLNGSLVKNYVFDPSERSKAYGFTTDGDLIHVAVLGDILNFKCRVRSKRKTEMDGPLAIQAIKGYLLIVSQEKVFVYNVSSQHHGRISGPRPLFFTSLDEIKSSFLNSRVRVEGSTTKIPLIATDRERLVVLGLGNGYVGMYRSNLPVFKTELNTVLWTSPILLFILFLFGACWQLVWKKRESVTSWDPDDPSSTMSVGTGSILGTASGDRTYADSSRATDRRELRGGALIGPSRRYVSPSRYPGGPAIPFRPSSADPNFRTGAELKFRGQQNIETTGFPKRRESMFPNSHAVEEVID